MLDVKKTLATLPEQFRPDHTLASVVDAFGGTNHITIEIRSDGIVNFYSTGATAWWRYNVTYIVGGVVRKLLNTLKMLTLGRGWVFC